MPMATSRANRAPPTTRRPATDEPLPRERARAGPLTVSGSRTRFSIAATQPPRRPAQTAATKAHGAPFGNTSAGQGSTFQTWDQAYSAASPMVPVHAPRMAPHPVGGHGTDPLDHQRLDEVEREVRRRVAEDATDDQREAAAHQQEDQ